MGRRPEARDQRPEARGQIPEGRGQIPEGRGQIPEARDQMPEARGRRQEARYQRPEGRFQRTDTRIQIPENWKDRIKENKDLWIMMTSDYRQLKIWQKSMQVAKDIYLNIVIKLPNEERFGLADQMRRSSISIPSNIAEGHARNSPKEFIHFLSISRGSIAELQTQLLFCNDVRYISDDLTNDLFSRLKEIDKMTFSLMKKLENQR